MQVSNQPHVDMVIRNDGTEAIGRYDFKCRYFLLDRARPIVEGSLSTYLDHVIRPREVRTVELEPNMFSDMGHVIQHRYDNAAWSCYISRILTATGQSISFEPGQLPTEGPPFGLAYAPVPDAMAGLLKVQPGSGMMVIKVQLGSRAEESGLKRGDVILAIDGHALKVVADLPDALCAAKWPAIPPSPPGGAAPAPGRIGGGDDDHKDSARKKFGAAGDFKENSLKGLPGLPSRLRWPSTRATKGPVFAGKYRCIFRRRSPAPVLRDWVVVGAVSVNPSRTTKFLILGKTLSTSENCLETGFM